ncbi:MAG: LysR substrate-binding domain-containing protein, partial [Pseudomonadales bacterium]
ETLKVQAYITAAIRLLGPRIAKFQQAFPQISLQLDSASRWDFDPQQADVALVFKESGQVSEHNWRGLFPYQVTPICAPSLLQGLANPASVAHILSLPLIEVHTQEQYWDMWLEAAGLEALKSRSTLSVDTLAIALEMALGGEGVALINGPFATRELDQGSLVLPFDCPLVLGEWGLVYAKDSPRQVQIEAFVDWIEHDLSTR